MEVLVGGMWYLLGKCEIHLATGAPLWMP